MRMFKLDKLIILAKLWLTFPFSSLLLNLIENIQEELIKKINVSQCMMKTLFIFLDCSSSFVIIYFHITFSKICSSRGHFLNIFY